MHVAIPHSLPKEEVRRRLRERTHEIADHVPGGAAEVTTDWPEEDRMNLCIRALGQQISGMVEVGDREVVFAFTLPPLLSFMEPVIRGAVEEKGHKLLAPTRG